MNLIKQLGGYERAKAFLNAASYTMDELIMMQRSGVRPQHVEKALLEYRRQHNIFEVGDKVVFKNVEKFKDNMLQVAHIELQKVLDIKSGLNGYTSFDELRHAEPEELEAGKRLEVK